MPDEDGDVQTVGNEPETEAVDKDAVFTAVSEEQDADLFIYSGVTDRALVGVFLNEADLPQRRTNAVLILSTLGGDADAAFIIARYLKVKYKKFILYVFGYCKSAGTLIALGADEIVMSDRGEMGPLDVQVLKSDELVFRSSGLDIASAVKSLSDQAFETFEKHFLQIIKRGGGAITTRTAADIASALSVGLISPITAQIDPLRVGEMERAINIAYEYGKRLNSKPNRVEALIKNYPSHSFVIDYKEAKELFENVRQPTEAEKQLESALRNFENETGEAILTRPNTEGMIGFLKPNKENQNVTAQQNTGEGGEQAELVDAQAKPVRGADGRHHPTSDQQNSDNGRVEPQAAQAATATPRRQE